MFHLSTRLKSDEVGKERGIENEMSCAMVAATCLMLQIGWKFSFCGRDNHKTTQQQNQPPTYKSDPLEFYSFYENKNKRKTALFLALAETEAGHAHHNKINDKNSKKTKTPNKKLFENLEHSR